MENDIDKNCSGSRNGYRCNYFCTLVLNLIDKGEFADKRISNPVTNSFEAISEAINAPVAR